MGLEDGGVGIWLFCPPAEWGGVSGLTWFAFVVHMEVFGSAGTGVPPKQQVVDGQLALPVALTLRQQLLSGTAKLANALRRRWNTK